MKFKAEFDLDNAAFEDNTDEIPSMLGTIAETVSQLSHAQQQAGYESILWDSNGNRVGSWEISQQVTIVMINTNTSPCWA